MEDKSIHKLFFLIIPVLLIPSFHFAATCTFTNNSGGNWNDANNWDCGRVPTSADEVIIDISSSATVTVDAGFAAVAQRVDVRDGELLVNGALTCSGTYFNEARLEIEDGTVTIAVNASIHLSDALEGIHFADQGSGELSNNGTVSIQNISGTGSVGIHLAAGLLQNSNNLTVDNCSDVGISGVDGDVRNLTGGTIRITNTGSHSIEITGTANFSNQICAYWAVDNSIFFASAPGDRFDNFGIFETSFSGSYTTLMDVFTNFSVVTDLNNAFDGVSNFDNQGVLIPGYPDGLCSGQPLANVFEINAGVDYDFSNWYTNANFTTLAGTYDFSLNIFSPSRINDIIGVNPLYIRAVQVEVGCVFAIPVNVTVGELPVITAPATVPTICPGSTITLDISVSGGVVSSGDYIYDWQVEAGDGEIEQTDVQDAVYTAPLGIGTFNTTINVADDIGCKSQATIPVNTADDEPPIPLCKDATVFLDADGQFVLDPSELDNGSSDNCALFTLSLSQDTFTCVDVGTVDVQLVVIDVAGVDASCVATVTVIDDIPPAAICKDITMQLNANGLVSIPPEDVDDGSSDACGINLSLDQTGFSTLDIGDQMVTLTVDDDNGNMDSCQSTVTVEAYDPVFVTDNPQLKVDDGINLRSSGNLYIVLDDMDFLNEGNMTAGNSTVVFAGNTDSQVLSGGDAFYNIEMSKADGKRIRLIDNTWINHQLSFIAENNKIEIHDQDLQLSATGTITGFDDNDYIQTNGAGYVKKEVTSFDFTFPVGFTDFSFRPVEVDQNGTSDIISVRNLQFALDAGLTGAPLPDVVNTSWEVIEAVPGDSDLNLDFQWQASDESPGFDRDSCGVAFFEVDTWKITRGDLRVANGDDPYRRKKFNIDELGVFAVGGVALQQGLLLKIKVQLQGANNPEGGMTANLTLLGHTPTVSPYNTGKIETTTNEVLNPSQGPIIVDWVLVELRDTDTNVVEQKSALVNTFGEVIDLDGDPFLEFETDIGGEYFVVVKHRNHLGIRTLGKVFLK